MSSAESKTIPTNDATATEERAPALASMVADMMSAPELSYEPRNTDEAWILAGRLFKSQLLPRWITSHEGAYTIMIAGRELGLTSMQSIRSLKMVEGNITMPAELMRARVKRSPSCLYLQLIEATDKIVTYETHRRGEPHPVRMSYTIEDAQRAGLASKPNWQRHPRPMLLARGTSGICREVYPEAVIGIHESTSDEVYDGGEHEAPRVPHREVPSAKPESTAKVSAPKDETKQEAKQEPTPKGEPRPDAAAQALAAHEMQQRIAVAATVEELLLINVSKAEKDRTISNAHAFELRRLGRARRSAIVAATKAAPADDFGSAERSPDGDIVPDHTGREEAMGS